MTKIRNVQLGLTIFTTIIIIYFLYYYYPIYTGTWDKIDTLFSISLSSFLYWVEIFLAILAIIAVTYGFYKSINLARQFMTFFLIYSSFWALVSIFLMRFQIYEHYLYFVLFIIFLMYLNLSAVKDYFKKSYDPDYFQQKENIYCYGEYTLYCRDVVLNSGNTRTYYFFSKKLPDLGVPCKKPEGYIVGINSRTGQPYLKKKKK